MFKRSEVTAANPLAYAIPFCIIVMCSIIDSFLTLNLMHKGFVELNPLMNLCLAAGTGWFFAVKYILTFGGVLVLYANRGILLFSKRFSVYHALLIVVIIYVLLVIYEVILVFLI